MKNIEPAKLHASRRMFSTYIAVKRQIECWNLMWNNKFLENKIIWSFFYYVGCWSIVCFLGMNGIMIRANMELFVYLNEIYEWKPNFCVENHNHCLHLLSSSLNFINGRSAPKFCHYLIVNRGGKERDKNAL